MYASFVGCFSSCMERRYTCSEKISFKSIHRPKTNLVYLVLHSSIQQLETTMLTLLTISFQLHNALDKCSKSTYTLKRHCWVTTVKAEDFTEQLPTSGSTALHGACYNGHLDMVKYLVEHGANYFIENHARETPIMNAKSQPKILDYFSGNSCSRAIR